MKYYEIKNLNQKRINEVPMHFAFGKHNFEAKLIELGCTVDDLVGLPAGGFMLKSEAHLFKEAIEECEEKLNAYLATDEGMVDALRHELANHEYCITYDVDDALTALGLNRNNERIKRLLPEAIDQYMDEAKQWLD